MHMRRAIGLSAFLLLVAACGGGDGAVTTTTAAGGSSTVPTTAATTTTEPAPELVWSRLPLDPANLGGPGEQRIAYLTTGGPGFIAVGAEAGDDPDAAIWASADGTTWTRIPHDEALFGGTSSQGINGAATLGANIVAVGYDYAVGPESSAAVWVSTDGLAWTRIAHDEAVFGGEGSQIIMSVVAGGPGLVAVGWDAFGGSETDAAVWLSADGLTWTRVAHDEATFGGDGRQTMSWVTTLGDTLVAVGWDESGGDFDVAVWTSADGVTWTRAPHDEATLGGDGEQRAKYVIAGGPGLVALASDDSSGTDDGLVLTSTDGITWARVDGAAFGGPDFEGVYSVAVGGPGLVAVGSRYVEATDDETGLVWTSPDGITWTLFEDEALFGGAGYQWMRTITATPTGLLAGGGDGLSDEFDAAFWVLAPAAG